LFDLTTKSAKTTKTLKRFYEQGENFLVKADLKSAQKSFESALKACQTASDSAGTSLCLLKLGRVWELLGEYDRAREIYQESLDLAAQLKDNQGVARGQAFLGNVAWAKGDYPKASKLLEEALSHFKAAENLPGQAWINDLMGNLYLAQGMDQEAETYHRAAYAIALQIGENPEGQAWNEFHLAAIELFRARLDNAREGFEKALKFFKSRGDILGQVASLIHLGEIACDQKKLMEAEKYILQSLRLVIPTQCKPLLADSLTGLARLLKLRRESQKAIGILMFALSHPTCRQQTKDSMASLAQSLEANFTQEEIKNGFRWAKELTMEELATTWLAALSPKPPTKRSSRK
jgi:tetratricopeptide (TPR) repeat protein